jgi:GNAT superfamily N-acetyltransferase
MTRTSGHSRALAFHPLTPDRWPDLVRLFGTRGACAGCWCMWPRLRGGEFSRGQGDGNRRALHRIVKAGDPPGLLAYAGGEPVGWCALGPREAYGRIENSRTLARVDDRPVWSVVCFFITRSHRKRGLTVRLLREAIRYARGRGARVLEGYPVEPRQGKTADVFAWTGLAASFRRAGFVEVARRSPTRPIMRHEIRGSRGAGVASSGRAREGRTAGRSRRIAVTKRPTAARRAHG